MIVQTANFGRLDADVSLCLVDDHWIVEGPVTEEYFTNETDARTHYNELLNLCFHENRIA